jgi:hypothetical protein
MVVQTRNQLNKIKMEELPIYDAIFEIESLSIDDLLDYMGADCWAVVIKRLCGSSLVKYNTYRLYDSLGGCFNQSNPNFIPNKEYLDEDLVRDDILNNYDKFLLEIGDGDEFHVYMFGSNGYQLVAKKHDNIFSILGYTNFPTK